MSKAKEIVTWMINYGAENTTTGDYSFDFDEINKKFGVDVCSDQELFRDIQSVIYNDAIGNKVSYFDFVECFEFTFWLRYCPNTE